jgi:phage baseplate assembly protein V
MQLADRKRRDSDGAVKKMNSVARIVETKKDPTGIFVRVQQNDRQNLISGWLSVLQIGAGGMRSAWCPRVGTLVKCSFFGNSIENGTVDGVLYTPTNPPPAGTTVDQVGMQFDDGSFVLVDPASGDLLIDFKGPVNIRTVGPATIDAGGDVQIKSAGQATVEAPNILLRGDVIIEGELQVNGGIKATGDIDCRPSGTLYDYRGEDHN